jgi:hypothetical protein
MTTQTEIKLITALRSMAALHDLEAPHLRKLASIAGEMAFPADKIVYREGDIGEAILFDQIAIGHGVSNDHYLSVMLMQDFGHSPGSLTFATPRSYTIDALLLDQSI